MKCARCQEDLPELSFSDYLAVEESFRRDYPDDCDGVTRLRVCDVCYIKFQLGDEDDGRFDLHE